MNSTGHKPANFFTQFLTKRHFLTRRGISALSVIVLLAGLIGFGIFFRPGANGAVAVEQESGLPVKTVTLVPVGEFQQTRKYTGVIKPRRSADLGFERSARLLSVLVDDGEAVYAGRELARLDVRSLNAQREELVAQQKSATALLTEYKNGPRKETIAAAKARVADLAAQASLQSKDFSRIKNLYDRGATSEQALDAVRFRFESAEAKRDSAQKELDELNAGTRQETIAAQQATVDQLSAAIQRIDVDLDNSILRAPFDGRIADRLVDEGTVVGPGQSVLRIVENGELEARIGLPSEVAAEYSADSTIELTVDGRTFDATFARRLPEVDLRTRLQMVVFRVPNDKVGTVFSGQIVRATIARTMSADAQDFWLPESALSPGVRGLWSAYAVIEKDGETQVERRHVTIVHTEGDRVLVRGTLAGGDRIVESGIQKLVPGQRVAPMDET